MVFPVVMYGCESWTVKKAEHRRINAFELWCWRRLLKVPWTAGRSNQSIVKDDLVEFDVRRLRTSCTPCSRKRQLPRSCRTAEEHDRSLARLHALTLFGLRQAA